MGKSKDIRNALATIMGNVQLGGETAFVQVLKSGTGEFSGYPSLRVIPGPVDTEKWAVGEQRRTVGFILRTYALLEDTPETELAAVDLIYDLTDLIMDTLDAGDYTGLLKATDNSLTNTIMNCTRGDFYEADGKGGAMLYCDVNVTVEYLKEL